MPVFFYMPKLGLNMVEGSILNWLINEGETVKAGQAIVEIETDKASQELETPSPGVVARIIKKAGEVVPCNTVMAVILADGEAMPAIVPDQIVEGIAPKSELGTNAPGTPSETIETRHPAADEQGRISISPAAKALASELGVNITDIKPRGSRIMREDVEAAYQIMNNRPQAETAWTRIEMPPLRRKISRHMAESARSTARVGMAIEADAGGLTGYKIAHEEYGKHYSYNVLLAKLAACALKEFPYMNTRLDGDALLQMHDINIGIAMDTPNGLLVPVLKNADMKDMPSLQADFDALASRAISGMTRVEDLEGGTFTLTNLGSLEIESFLPVINTPECAILGIGAIIRKAVVEGDTVVIRPRVNLTLAFDHRIVDGAPAGKFLQRLKQLVELAQFS